MLTKVYSYGINGLDAYPVIIEVDISRGLPATIIVGLPDSAIKESKERVRAALKNSGYEYKPRRTIINLSPADTKKEGPSFDLAIALGILAATDQMEAASLSRYAVLGELSLDGRVQPVKGTLSVALKAAEKNPPLKGLILPVENATEAGLVKGVPLFPVRYLGEAVDIISRQDSATPFVSDFSIDQKPCVYDVDFSDVKGQAHVKRGLEIAAAGGHNALLIGPPGSGKSMLAKRIPTILPNMTTNEALETTKIHSVMGLLHKEPVLVARPFRSPHHTTSDVAIVGGGSMPKPGEVTLSHNGILFLDELPEFSRSVLESLRQPLEDKCVTVSRTAKTLRFPARFMLIAAMNPCPCGWWTDPRRECHCSQQQIERYLSKISGPLLDRIDIHLEVPALSANDMLIKATGEPSCAIKERTVAARERQLKRFQETGIHTNAQMSQQMIKQTCALGPEAEALLKSAIDELKLSARAYDKILKVARTIADLDGHDTLEPGHIAEAIQYRFLDRNWWG